MSLPADWPLTDAQCAEAFRRARWPPEGRPVCPRCRQADRVGPRTSRVDGRLGGVRLWHCRDCRYMFSDLAGTVLANRGRRGLAHWALVCLDAVGAVPARWAEAARRIRDANWKRRTDRREGLRVSWLARAWAEELGRSLKEVANGAGGRVDADISGVVGGAHAGAVEPGGDQSGA